MAPFTLLQALLLTLVFVFSYIFLTTVYNIYFHPLAKFPGPKLAAASKLYEFCYDVLFFQGQFYNEIHRMHKVYGPIIRISPDELHVNDPDFYEVLYSGPGTVRDKYSWFTRAGGSPTSSFATVPHDLHRTRRSALNPLFSKRSVSELEPMIQSKVSLLCDGIEAQFRRGKPMEFGAAYMSLALDVVTQYCFGEKECWNCLLEPGFSVKWKEAMSACMEAVAPLRYAAWVMPVLQKLPIELVSWFDRSVGLFLASIKINKNNVMHFLQDENISSKDTQRTIFSELRNGDMPDREKEPQRLIDESNIMIIAGGDALTQILTVISFHLLDNPAVLAQLQNELKTVMTRATSSVTWKQLENLPYLNAVYLEGLRISAIVTTRLPRVAPRDILRYGEWVIPRDTPVSMTGHFIHLDPSLFPEPFIFEPNRWTAPEVPSPVGKGSKKYLIPFSRGTRGCLGRNLADAQALIAIARVFRRFDFEFYATTRRDVEIVRDCFNGQPFKKSKGVRVTVVKQML